MKYMRRLCRRTRRFLHYASGIASLSEMLVLGIMWVFFAGNIVLWEQANKRFYAFDQIGHFFNSVAVAGVISHPWVLFDFSQYLSRLASEHAMYFTFELYPPFVYVVTSLFYFIWPPSLPLAASSNIVFLLVLEVSTYALAKHFYGRIAGVAAAFLVSAYPILVGISRTYLLEFALTATVSISLYLLAREHVLESKRTAFLLALSLAVGMLTKESFLFYVAGPVIYVFVKNSRDRVALKNAMLVILIASTSVVYYVIKPGGILAYLVYQSIPQQRGVAALPPISAWAAYASVLFESGVGVPLVVFFVAGGAVALTCSRYRMFTIIGLLTPIVLLGLFEPYYVAAHFTAPVLPLVAATSAALFKGRPRRSQILAGVIVAILALAQYAPLTYNSPVLSGLSVVAEPDTVRYSQTPPSTDDWMISRIVGDIRQDASHRFLARPSLVVLTEMAYFEQTLFLYYAYMENLNLAVMDNGYLSTRVGIDSVCSTNYVVDRPSIDQSVLSGPEANMAGVSRFVESNLDHFESIGTYSLPDGSVASLYYRTLSCSTITLGLSSHFEPAIQTNCRIKSNIQPMNFAI